MEASSLQHVARPAPLVGGALLRLKGDEPLVALVRGGNAAAFEVLFRRYQPQLLAFCRHMLGSSEDAEDVLQEAFAAAHRAMLADERPIAARAWLYRIARNRCLDHLRRPAALAGQDSMDVFEREGSISTAEVANRRAELRELLGDIGNLPETQRSALLMREIDALSHEQIAAAMETTVPSVKSLLVRARIALTEVARARSLTCDDVRLSLAEAAEGIAKSPPEVRHHVRACTHCQAFKRDLRRSTRALAAVFPIGPLVIVKHFLYAKVGSGLLGGGAASGGGSGAVGTMAASTTAGTAATSATPAAAASAAAAGAATGMTTGGAASIGAGAVAAKTAAGALAAKAAAGLAAAAVATGGAVELDRRADTSKPTPYAAAERQTPGEPRSSSDSTPLAPRGPFDSAARPGLVPDAGLTPVGAALPLADDSGKRAGDQQRGSHPAPRAQFRRTRRGRGDGGGPSRSHRPRPRPRGQPAADRHVRSTYPRVRPLMRRTPPRRGATATPSRNGPGRAGSAPRANRPPPTRRRSTDRPAGGIARRSAARPGSGSAARRPSTYRPAWGSARSSAGRPVAGSGLRRSADRPGRLATPGAGLPRLDGTRAHRRAAAQDRAT